MSAGEKTVFERLSPRQLAANIEAAFSASGEAVTPDRWWIAFADSGLTQTIDAVLAARTPRRSRSRSRLVPRISGAR